MSSLVRYAALTCVGLRRDHNEDAVVIHDRVLQGDVLAPITGEVVLAGSVLLAVADGLGGHAAGQQASALVAHGLAGRAEQIRSVEDIVGAVTDLNDELYRQMKVEPATRGMGTTVAGVLVRSDTTIVFHVGDSRVYARHGDRLVQVTRDDVLTVNSYILTQCLGGEDRPTPVDVHVTTIDAHSELLICSDGLSDMVSIDRVDLDLDATPAVTAIALRELAFDAGANDNISIIYARVED